MPSTYSKGSVERTLTCVSAQGVCGAQGAAIATPLLLLHLTTTVAAMRHGSTFINDQINHQKFNRKRINAKEHRLQMPPTYSHDKNEVKN